MGRHKATQSLTSEWEYCQFYPILLVKAIQVDKHGIEGKGNIPCSFHKRNCKVTQQRTWIERNTELGPMMQSTISGHLHLYRNSSSGSSIRGRYWTFIQVSQWSDLGSDTKLPIFCLLVQIFKRKNQARWARPVIGSFRHTEFLFSVRDKSSLKGHYPRNTKYFYNYHIHTRRVFFWLPPSCCWQFSWFLVIWLLYRQLPLGICIYLF